MDSEKVKAVAKHPLVLGGTPLVLTLIVLFQSRADFKAVGDSIVEQVKANTAKVEKNTSKVEALDKTMAVLGERVDKLTEAIGRQQNDHDKVIALQTEVKNLKERINRLEGK